MSINLTTAAPLGATQAEPAIDAQEILRKKIEPTIQGRPLVPAPDTIPYMQKYADTTAVESPRGNVIGGTNQRPWIHSNQNTPALEYPSRDPWSSLPYPNEQVDYNEDNWQGAYQEQPQEPENQLPMIGGRAATAEEVARIRNTAYTTQTSGHNDVLNQDFSSRQAVSDKFTRFDRSPDEYNPNGKLIRGTTKQANDFQMFADGLGQALVDTNTGVTVEGVSNYGPPERSIDRITRLIPNINGVDHNEHTTNAVGGIAQLASGIFAMVKPNINGGAVVEADTDYGDWLRSAEASAEAESTEASGGVGELKLTADGKLPYDAVLSMLSKGAKTHFGVDPIDAEAIAGATTYGMIQEGSFAVSMINDPASQYNGQYGLTITSQGMEYRNTMIDMYRSLNWATKEKANYSPAEAKSSNMAQRFGEDWYRRKDKHVYYDANGKPQTNLPMEEAAVNFGQSAREIPYDSMSIQAITFAVTIAKARPTPQRNDSDKFNYNAIDDSFEAVEGENKTLNKIMDMSISKKQGNTQAYNAVINLHKSIFGTVGDVLDSGLLHYGKMYTDYVSYRMYDASPISAQRNKKFRNMHGTKVPVQMNKLNMTLLGYNPFNMNDTLFNNPDKLSSQWEEMWDGELKRRHIDSDAAWRAQNPANFKVKMTEWLMTFGHVVGKIKGKQVDGKMPFWYPEWLNTAVMNEMADVGDAMKLLVQQTGLRKVNGEMDLQKFNSITQDTKAAMGFYSELLNNPDAKAAYETLMGFLANRNIKDDTQAFAISAAIDASNLRQAIKNGTTFTPTLSTAIDQNSAGRAFKAWDVAKTSMLRAVGMLWYPIKQAGLALADRTSLSFGSPRDLFWNNLPTALPQVLGTDHYRDRISTVVQFVNNYYRDQFVDPITNKVRDYSEAKSFVDNFGKKVGMLTVYGVAPGFHSGSVESFTQKESHFTEGFAKALGLDWNNPLDQDEIVEILRAAIEQTLYNEGDVWQSKVPKDMLWFTQMMNKLPVYNDFTNNKATVPSIISQDNGRRLTFSGGYQQTPYGTSIVSKDAIQGAGGVATAKEIRVKNEVTGKYETRVFFPRAGTGPVNVLGTQLGQNRESALLMYIVNGYFGGTDVPVLHKPFAIPVFDNLILDSGSFVGIFMYANNIALPNTLGVNPNGSGHDYNMAMSFIRGWEETVSEMQKELRELAANKQMLKIGKGDPYYGMLFATDQIIFWSEENLRAAQEGKLQLTEERKKQLQADIDTAHKNGYVSVTGGQRLPDGKTLTAREQWDRGAEYDDRIGIEITPQQAEGLLRLFMKRRLEENLPAGVDRVLFTKDNKKIANNWVRYWKQRLNEAKNSTAHKWVWDNLFRKLRGNFIN